MNNTMNNPFVEEHMEALLNGNEIITAAIAKASSQDIARAAYIREYDGDFTYLDLTDAYVMGPAQKLVGDTLPERSAVVYVNKWPTSNYATNLTLSHSEYMGANERNWKIEAKAMDVASAYMQAAFSELSDVIQGGYGVAGKTPVYSLFSDTPTNLLFSISQTINGKTFSGTTPFPGNWRVTHPIVTGTADAATAYTYAKEALEHWENLPNKDGEIRGLGNRLEANLLILCSYDIAKWWREFSTAPTLTSGSPNCFYGVPYVVVPGLEAGTTVFTRRPDSDIPGFIWGYGPNSYYAKAAGEGGNIKHRWDSWCSAVVAPTCWMASLLLK